MKRHIPTIVLFVAVFAVSFVFQRYTLMGQGMWSLFLFTPDWFHETLSLPLPISRIVSDFLLQFYDIPLVAPAITAALVLCVYLIGGSILLACAAWLLASLMPSPQFAVLALFAAILLRIVQVVIKKRIPSLKPALKVIPVAAVALAIALLPSVSHREIQAKAELCARQAEWNKVLSAVTPEVCREDRSMLPYAALALSSEGRLTRDLGVYGFREAQELDMEGVQSREGYYFSSLMYEALGCPNEAIHRIFQAGCHLDHGTAYIVLYQLIRYNIERGDYTMVRKYAGILARSPRHSSLAKKTLKAYGSLPDTCEKKEKASITNNPIYNIPMLYRQGIETKVSADLFQAYMTLTQQ